MVKSTAIFQCLVFVCFFTKLLTSGAESFFIARTSVASCLGDNAVINFPVNNVKVWRVLSSLLWQTSIVTVLISLAIHLRYAQAWLNSTFSYEIALARKLPCVLIFWNISLNTQNILCNKLRLQRSFNNTFIFRLQNENNKLVVCMVIDLKRTWVA